jgi:drug/metabolite transporter (DMT)-like permease
LPLLLPLLLPCAVFQILRGAEMLFAALFAVTLLHRPLNRWHAGGVALCLVRTGYSLLAGCVMFGFLTALLP